MNIEQLSRRPHFFEPNRVQRFFTGGRLLNRWQGLPDGTDSNWSEELLVTTNEYVGPSGGAERLGLSRTILVDGTELTLRDMIALDETGFLGKRYAGRTDGQAGVLTRAGDSTVRLALQFHPNGADARKYLDSDRGKTEAWYILDTRTIDGVDPYVLAGNRPGVTRGDWEDAFKHDDVERMCGFLHRIPVSPGDVILIPAGIPHALGSGCVFLEFHEACDYTFRLEQNFLGVNIDPRQMHYGLGFDKMFDLINYETWTEEDLRNKAFMKKRPVEEIDGGKRSNIITYNDTPEFAVDIIELNGRMDLPEFDDHYIIVTTGGETKFTFSDGTMTVPQGRGIFVPANVESLTAEGEGEIFIGYPYRTNDNSESL